MHIFTFSVFVGIFDLDSSEPVHLITDSLIAKNADGN